MLTDLIPARYRATVYTLLAVVSLAAPIVAEQLGDGFQADDVWRIVMGVLAAGGFSLANANTDAKPWPWPAPTGDPQNLEG